MSEDKSKLLLDDAPALPSSIQTSVQDSLNLIKDMGFIVEHFTEVMGKVSVENLVNTTNDLNYKENSDTIE